MLKEVWFERPSQPDGLGDLHVGRVSARMPALSGVFVALAEGQSGFLPDAQGGHGLSEGDFVAVSVVRAAQGGKGPRLTAKVPPSSPRTGPLRMVARGPIAAERLARVHLHAPIRSDSLLLAAQLRATWGAGRVSTVPPPAFDDALEAGIEVAASPEVPLSGGGRLLIHVTPALTAIDVDAGSFAGQDRDAHRRLNETALREAARQVRLRQLAGPLLLDLAGMRARSRASFLPGLRGCVDPLTRVVGVTGLGLIELVRTRVGPPLNEVLGTPASPLTCGLAALRRAVREGRTTSPAPRTLRASPAVALALREQTQALAEYAAAAAYPLLIQPDPSVQAGKETFEA